MEAMKKAMKKQLEKVFSGGYTRKDGTKVTLNMDAQIRKIDKVTDLKETEYLYEITKMEEGVFGGTTAHKKHIKLNSLYIEDIMNGKSKAIPHEAGHTLGWSHPNEKNTLRDYFDPNSIDKDEQYMEDGANVTNLMYQSIYQTKIFKLTGAETTISVLQVNIMLRNYKEGKINKKSKIHKQLFGE